MDQTYKLKVRDAVIDQISPESVSYTHLDVYKRQDSTLHEQERDILKVWKKGKDHKVIFGIENQTSTDKQMSFRVMGYDLSLIHILVLEMKTYPKQ